MKHENISFLSIKKDSDRIIVSFNNLNRLTALNSQSIRIGLMPIITKRDCLLEVDLSDIIFIDNSIVDTFNLISRMARRYNSRVVLSNVSKELSELIDLVKQHSVFDIKQISTIPNTLSVA